LDERAMAMRWAWIGLLAVMIAQGASGQISTDEAQRILAEKQAAREKSIAEDRAKLVTIKKGDLDDMKAELLALRTELSAIKAAQPKEGPAGNAVTFEKAAPQKIVTTPPAVKFVLEIKVGVTRQQLQTFIAQRKEHFRITKDARQAADKQELITLEKFEIKPVEIGTRYNGVGKVKEYHDEKVPLATWELVLINDIVTDMTRSSGRMDIDAR